MRGKIGCTRKQDAHNREELQLCLLQKESLKNNLAVDWAKRFEDCTTPETVIKTDGMLHIEALIVSEMGSYSCIMLDEAHERTENYS